MAEHPLAHHFAEVLSQVKPDPACRECKGKGPRLGFRTTPDKAVHLELCCGSIGETEYVRLRNRIDGYFANLNKRIDDRVWHEEQHFNDLLEAVREQSWLYRVRKWWRNRGKMELHIKGGDLWLTHERERKRRERTGIDQIQTPEQMGGFTTERPAAERDERELLIPRKETKP